MEKKAHAFLEYLQELTEAKAREDTTNNVEQPVMASPTDPVVMGSWFRRNLFTSNTYIKDSLGAVLDSLGASENGPALQNENGMIKLWSEKEEKQRAAKYAAIECIEERTFTILQDLGMVDATVDFAI